VLSTNIKISYSGNKIFEDSNHVVNTSNTNRTVGVRGSCSVTYTQGNRV